MLSKNFEGSDPSWFIFENIDQLFGTGTISLRKYRRAHTSTTQLCIDKVKLRALMVSWWCRFQIVARTLIQVQRQLPQYQRAQSGASRTWKTCRILDSSNSVDERVRIWCSWKKWIVSSKKGCICADVTRARKRIDDSGFVRFWKRIENEYNFFFLLTDEMMGKRLTGWRVYIQ